MEENKIKVEELRVGNYYGYYNDCEGEVLGITYSSFSNSGNKVAISIEGGGYTVEAIDGLKPIKLNDEVYKRCGFEQMPLDKNESYHGNADKNFGNPVLWLNDTIFLATNGSDKFLFLNGLRIPCEFLHQLQNIYYSLTGKEIVYKSKQ